MVAFDKFVYHGSDNSCVILQISVQGDATVCLVTHIMKTGEERLLMTNVARQLQYFYFLIFVGAEERNGLVAAAVVYKDSETLRADTVIANELFHQGRKGQNGRHNDRLFIKTGSDNSENGLGRLNHD